MLKCLLTKPAIFNISTSIRTGSTWNALVMQAAALRVVTHKRIN